MRAVVARIGATPRGLTIARAAGAGGVLRTGRAPGRTNERHQCVHEGPVEVFRFLVRRVVRGLLEPDQTFGRRLDPLEIARRQHRGYLPVMPPQHEHDGRLDPGQPVVEIERAELFPQMVEREPVPLAELDQVDQVRLVGLQRRPDEPAGRQLAVK